VAEAKELKALFDNVLSNKDSENTAKHPPVLQRRGSVTPQQLNIASLNSALKENPKFKKYAGVLFNADKQTLVAHSLTFKDFIKLIHPSLPKWDLEYIISACQFKLVPDTLILKIKSVFDELDTAFDGKVKLGQLLALLAPSTRLAEYTTIHPLSLKSAEYNQYVTLHQLYQYLFEKTHRSQLLQIMKVGRQSAPLTVEQKQDLISLFNLYDSDGSGTIDFDEMKQSALSLAQSLSDDEIQILFDQFDFDKDKKITIKEFTQFYRNCWSQSVNFDTSMLQKRSNPR